MKHFKQNPQKSMINVQNKSNKIPLDSSQNKEKKFPELDD